MSTAAERTCYDHNDASHVGNDDVVYYVQASGDRWFPTGYDGNRTAHATASAHNDLLNDKGVQAINASPPNTGTGATGYDITPPTTTRHLYTSQIP